MHRLFYVTFQTVLEANYRQWKIIIIKIYGSLHFAVIFIDNSLPQ